MHWCLAVQTNTDKGVIPPIVAREYLAGLRVRAISSDELGVCLQVREHL